MECNLLTDSSFRTRYSGAIPEGGWLCDYNYEGACSESPRWPSCQGWKLPLCRKLFSVFDGVLSKMNSTLQVELLRTIFIYILIT
jgi:hypothetical protein